MLKSNWYKNNISSGVIIGISVALISAIINTSFWYWQLSKTREDKLKDRKIEILNQLVDKSLKIRISASYVVIVQMGLSKIYEKWEDSLKRKPTEYEELLIKDQTEKKYPEASKKVKEADDEFYESATLVEMAKILFKNELFLKKWSDFIDIYQPNKRDIIINNIVYTYLKQHNKNKLDDVPFSYIEKSYVDQINKSLVDFVVPIEVEIYTDNN